jgi:divalent metal cation (Fe/Co/Zn/Cd) transporter
MVAALAIIWAAARTASPTRSRWSRWGSAWRCRWLSSALNGGLAWAMLRKAREMRSMALEADARHLVTDVWTSAGVVVGILAVVGHGLALARPAGAPSPWR